MTTDQLTPDQARELLALAQEWLRDRPGSMTRRAHLLRTAADALANQARSVQPPRLTDRAPLARPQINDRDA
jgi:hypothetical protein